MTHEANDMRQASRLDNCLATYFGKELDGWNASCTGAARLVESIVAGRVSDSGLVARVL